MMPATRSTELDVAVVYTGVANLASAGAMLDRFGVRWAVADSPDMVEHARVALVPGVGAFGPAMQALRTRGLDEALRKRFAAGKPSMGICLGMQLFFEASEESPGTEGLGILRGTVRRLSESLPLPQLGWNRIKVESVPVLDQPQRHKADEPALRQREIVRADASLVPGWMYFANSFAIPLGLTQNKLQCPEAAIVTGSGAEELSWFVATACYDRPFLAALECSKAQQPLLLLMQFHPELSGRQGAAIVQRFLNLAGVATPTAAVQPEMNLEKEAARDDVQPVVHSRWNPTSSETNSAENAGLAVRIVPCLDFKDGRVVKGVHFTGLADAGDAVELACRYETEGADELVFLDISATVEGRTTLVDTVKAIRRKLSIPLTIGGGIRSLDDAGRLLDAGADRVSLNSAAVRNPQVIDSIAQRYGVQCMVVAIDARANPALPSGYEVCIAAGSMPTGIDAVAWAREAAARGAGEILLTSIDRDGTNAGYDLALTAAIAKAVTIPVMASGGAALPEHFLEGWRVGARALLAAGTFHRGDLPIAVLKRFLLDHNVEVRL